MLLLTKNLKLKVPKKIIAPRFVGPYRIVDAVGAQAYRLALLAAARIYNVFYVSMLEP